MTLRGQLAYATPVEQVTLELDVPPGTTVEQVIRACGILARFPEIDVSQAAVGIFGERAALADVVEQGDRVEIYRPLIADPKETRRRRARKRQRR